ncbi:unnamed protein product [Symbiodinium pilosum]|uniref:Uncharacterized protein n=1 Tax=Symbiodinium pilosum TaxID=2952 RepID=A0A812N0N5_SYMPI|nr:unnamed protein product [Symbiodinium pilosum]
MGVSPTDLWCFHIERAAALPEPLAARQYIPKRFSRVYTVVNCISMREISAECTEVPDWMDSELSREEGEEDGMHVAAMFPEEVVMLCVHKALDVLILPSPHSQGWWTPAGWLRRRFNPDLQHAFEAARAHLIRPDVELCHAFHLQDCGQLAEDLRFCLESGLPGQEQILAQWVGHLQEREDSMQMYSRSDRLAVFMQMIELVMLAEKIRNTADLRDVMQRSLRIVLPEDLHELAANMLQNKVQKFDKGRVSRAHLTIDAGFMLQQRIYNRTSPDQLRYLMWDSSPQFGRDYQMCLLQSVAKSDLPSILQNLVQLCQLREDDDAINFDDDAVLEQEQMLMSDLRSKIRTHALPTVLIGFGAATFQRKLRALLHSARLEVFTKEDLAPWCESLVSVASDYGVEHLLSDVRGLPAETATCWFQDTDSADIQLLLNGPRGSDLPGPRQAVDQAREAHANFDAEGFEDPHAAPAAVDMQLLAGPIAEEDFELPPQVQLNFEHLLSVPGLLHVIDNATKGLGDVMQRYEDNIALAQQVCRLLRKRDSKPKLLERCFSRGVGAQLASDIREFQGWIHPGRWGTVVFSIPELLKVKHALVSCWDERVYLQGNDAVADEGRRQDAMNLAADVTKAVSDPAWWGWLSMLEVVCSLLRKHTFWAESCPCHSHILQSNRGELTAELKQHFERCPLRGKRERGPERKACLSAMESAGLLQRVSEDDRFSKWLLLGKGEAAIKAGYCARRPHAALAIREDIEASSRAVWELIAILDQQGWAHMTVEKNKSQEPYVPGSGPLLWYSKPGDDTICVWYLRALLQGTVEVPHWQASGFYQALVEGRPVSKRSRCSKASLAIKNVDPDEWDVPLPLPMPKAKAKRAAKKRKLMLPAPNLNDREAVDNIAVIEEPERQALADDAETANSDDFEDELLAELEAVLFATGWDTLSEFIKMVSRKDGR